VVRPFSLVGRNMFNNIDKNKDKKGTIEISIYERDVYGNLSGRKRNFSSDKGDKVSEFWFNNEPAKKRGKVNN
jgi:hypothetical protein